MTGGDLGDIARALGLNSHTEALEEAVTVLLLILKGGRTSFLVEEKNGPIIKINLK